MYEGVRTGSVIHSARTVGGGAGSRFPPLGSGRRTCSRSAWTGRAHVTAPQSFRRT